MKRAYQQRLSFTDTNKELKNLNPNSIIKEIESKILDLTDNLKN